MYPVSKVLRPKMSSTQLSGHLSGGVIVPFRGKLGNPFAAAAAAAADAFSSKGGGPDAAAARRNPLNVVQLKKVNTFMKRLVNRTQSQLKSKSIQA